MSRKFKGPRMSKSSQSNNFALENSNNSDSLDQECRLFVGNVPVQICTKVVLYNMFMNEGQVKEVYCHPSQPNASRSWAMITYYCKRDALQAITEFHGKPPHYLRVEFSKGRSYSNNSRKSQFEVSDGDSKSRKHKPAGSKHGSMNSTDQPESPSPNHQFTNRNDENYIGLEYVEDVNGEEDSVISPDCELFKEQELLSADTFTKVVVAYSNGPFEYWVVLQSNYAQVLLLSEELSKYEHSHEVFIPSIGKYCMAKFEQAWYRAKILAIQPLIKVFYIDFGNVTTVTPEDLRELPNISKNVKSQAILIRLAPGTSQEYENLCEQSELMVKAHGKQDEAYVACIEGENYGEIHDDLIQQERRRAIEMQALETEELPCIGLEEGYCVISAVFDKELYIRSVHTSALEALVVIQNELRNHCATASPLGRTPEVGEVLAAKFSDGNFYRAVVKDVNLPEGIQVQYIDFGNIEYIKCEDLKPLNENLLNNVCLAVKVEIIKVVSNIFVDNTKSVLEKYVIAESPLHLEFDYIEDGIIFIYAPLLTVVGKAKIYPDEHYENEDRILTIRDIKVERWLEKTVGDLLIYEVLDYNCVAAAMANSRVQKALHGKYQTMINEYCKMEDPYVPEEGELCLCLIDDCWYRCYCKAKGDNFSVVMLLDTREFNSVSHKNTRKMQKKFTRLPVAGLECIIDMRDDVSRKDKWAAIGYLSRNKKLEATVLARDGYGYRVKIPEIDNLLNE